MTLDDASLAFAAKPGYSVRYKFLEQVYDIEQYSFGPDNHELVRSTFFFDADGQVQVTGYATTDRMVVVTGIAQLLHNGQVVASSPPYQVLAKTPLSPTTVQQTVDLLQAVRDLAQQFGNRANDVINAITSNPEGFLSTLKSGLQMAGDQFLSNLPQNVTNAFFGWLGQGRLDATRFDLSALTGAGGVTLDGVGAFLLQYAGLTWDNVQNIVLQELGEGNVAAVTQVVDELFGNEPDTSNPNTMLAFVRNLANKPGLIDDFSADTLVSQAKDKVLEQIGVTVARAIPQLVARFVPGPGGLFGTVQSIYRGLSWVLDNRQQLQGVIDQFLDGLGELAAGNADGLRDKLLAGMQAAAPSLISFAASQLGLSRLPGELSKGLQFIPEKVEQTLRKAVRTLAAGAVAGGGTGAKVFDGRLTPRRTPSESFTYVGAPGKSFVVFAARDSEGTRVKIVEGAGPGAKLVKVFTAADFKTNPTAQAHFSTYLAKAEQLAAAAKGKPVGQPASPAERDRLTRLKVLQQQVIAAENAVIADIQANACPWLGTGCFAAGTKLLTRRGCGVGGAPGGRGRVGGACGAGPGR